SPAQAEAPEGEARAAEDPSPGFPTDAPPAPVPGSLPFNLRAQRPPNYLRAALWNAGILGVGALWYYFVDQPGVTRIRPPWRERFTRDVVRLDNNSFEINFIGHPMTGAYSYALPRANGRGLPAAAEIGRAHV